MLDDFLLNLPQEEKLEYGMNDSVLNQDMIILLILINIEEIELKTQDIC